jgi:hypothetical protein
MLAGFFPGTFCFVPAEAQTLIRGRILDTRGSPISHARVNTDLDSAVVRVNAFGEFMIRATRAGLLSIQARAVGFYPDRRRLLISGQDTISVVFRLEPAAQALESLAVTAPAPVPARMQPFEERRRAGFGKFFTRELLRSQEHRPLGDVLSQTAGVRLVRRPTRCGGGFAVAVRGGATSQPWMRCATGDRFPVACYVSVFLDGISLYTTGSIEPIDINQFAVNGLEAIELYRGPSETPIQYLGTGSACGALVLWTRSI